MAVVVKEDTKPYTSLDDEEDALLNEAICCSRNLEIKTDDDEEENEEETKKKTNSEQSNAQSQIQQKTKAPWCDVESDSNNSDLSNGKIDLSTSDGKLELSTSNGKMENSKSLHDHTNKNDTETGEIKEEQNGMNDKEIEEMMDTNDTENVSPVRKRQREGGDNDEDEQKVSRNRRNSNSSSSTMSNNSKKNVEYETDAAVLARRQKDIDYGKNTIGYDRYTQEIPKDKRTKDHPRTPPMYTKYSRRGWDGMVKLWRKQLHFWDPKEDEAEKKDDVES